MSFESSLYFQEEIYIWEKNIHIYNQMQIYVYTQYILKKKFLASDLALYFL